MGHTIEWMHPQTDNPTEPAKVEEGVRSVARPVPGAAWVTVGEFANGVDADLSRVLLESRGVPVLLENREFVGMDWLVAAAVGWIKVQVPPDRAHEAVTVLRKASESRGPDVQLRDTDALRDAERCLRCGGAMPVGDSVCDACGWSYTETLDAEETAAAPGSTRGRVEHDPAEDAAWRAPGWRHPVVVAVLILVVLWFVFVCLSSW